ncbi:MAG: ester cyclase [Dehalococcoidia bacterium]|nr:ester cyclase [Dehalococcoidia bacterium]MCB9485353.1 ester cyclase [Thermoflexaceae bacterium]
MSAEEERNLDAARRWTHLYNTDPDRCCDEMLTDDCEVLMPARNVHDKGGREGYRLAVRTNLEALPDRRQRVLSLAADGDRVFVEMVWEGTSSGVHAQFGPEGSPFRLHCISLLRFVEGCIASETVFV